MAGYREKDAARDTGASRREVEKTWHHARDQSGVRDGGDGDRPTAQNRLDGKAKTREIIDRARKRRDEGGRDQRQRPRDVR